MFAQSTDGDGLNEDAHELMMTKDDAKAVMRSKEFENFFDKTSKIIERALTGGVDVLGAQLFFEEVSVADEDGVGAGLEVAGSKKEKLNPMFIFQDNEPTQRTITSIEWSPKVSLPHR
jgi:hypothetical protein